MASDPIKIFLAGDVMLGRGIDQALPFSASPKIYESYMKDAREYIRLAEKANGPIPQPVKYDYIWGDAMKVWEKESPAFKLINLETSITTHNKPWPDKGIQYRMHPENIQVLQTAGIDHVSLANNHVLDWGVPGLLETINTLQLADIPYSGAGTNEKQASKPSMLNYKNGRLIIYSYGSPSAGVPAEWAAKTSKPGVNYLPHTGSDQVKSIANQIQAVKQPGDIVILSIHWGSNWGYQVPDSHRDFAHQLIDEAGVDLIFGHSSHHPRPIEVYHNKLIMYGAGDFINDYEGISGYERFRDDLPLMYFPTIDLATGNLLELKLVPMQIKNFKLNHPSQEDARWLFKTINRESKAYNASFLLNDDGTLSLEK